MKLSRYIIDQCALEEKKEFLNLEERVSNIKSIAKSKGIFVFEERLVDPTRITLGVWSIGKTGYEFRDYLYKYKILF